MIEFMSNHNFTTKHVMAIGGGKPCFLQVDLIL